MALGTCSFCKTPFSQTHDDSSGFVFCLKCALPELKAGASSPFAVLGIPVSFSLDEKDLEARYYGLSKLLHPDRFASMGGAARIKSQQLAAVLNQAYLALRTQESRLETLLKMNPISEENRSTDQKQLPAELAEEYFELQEAVLEGDARAQELIENFRKALEEKRLKLTSEMNEIAARTQWSKAASSEVKKIVELRKQRSYLRSMLENLERLG